MTEEILAGMLRERIAQQGPITFAEFMEAALYHPEHGYYSSTSERVGAHGDFSTSPTTHPVFGTLIGCQLWEMWELLDRPRKFTVVEMGCGDGLLCRDILSSVRVLCPDFFRSVRYVLVERSAGQRERQGVTLAELREERPDLESVESLDEMSLDKIEGCFLSNELVDAFPVHRVAKVGGRLREVYVGLADGQFVDVLGEPSSLALEDHLQWVGVALEEGQYAEVNLLAPEWMRQVGSRLQRGFALTVDYGYTAQQLYAPSRRGGTLLSYRRHCWGTDQYQRVGLQDLTAHVDFSALVKAGLPVGLEFTGLTSQQSFLMSLGLREYAEGLRDLRLPAPEFQANVRAMDALIRPEQLGNHRVLVQHKGIDYPNVTGLGAVSERKLDVRGSAASLPRLRWHRPSYIVDRT